MASSPLSGVLSPAQIAIVQQARQALRPQPQAQPAENAQPPVRNAARPTPARGRGQIIDISV
jgi:hypothetical protein